jgi:hypothetical protein
LKLKLPAALALGLLVAACQPAPPPAATTSPSPSPVASPTPAPSLTGKWLTGSGAEPAAGPKTVALDCSAKYGMGPDLGGQTWEVQQVADQLTYQTTPQTMAGPTGPDPACPPRGEQGTGTFTGTGVTLTGTAKVEAATCPSPFDGSSPAPTPAPTVLPVAYALTYDPSTKHLKGTRNGQPFWAVPLIFTGPPEDCGSVPVP